MRSGALAFLNRSGFGPSVVAALRNVRVVRAAGLALRSPLEADLPLGERSLGLLGFDRPSDLPFLFMALDLNVQRY